MEFLAYAKLASSIEFTFKLNDCVVPKQPFIFGVTTITPVNEAPFGTVPVALNEVISLIPVAGNPIDGFEFVQSNCVFAEPVNTTELKLVPLHTVM